MPSFLTAHKRFQFFCGKGGVGKTTCAAAVALASSERRGKREEGREARVLAISLDPAHSLRDVLAPSSLFTLPSSLDVLELDARAEFAAFLREHERELRTVADRGTYLDDEDVQGFLDLSLPGLDEVMGLLKLGQLDRDDRYQHVVVDLPPTGHALRLFDVSAAFNQLVE